MRKLGLFIIVVTALALVPFISWATIAGTPHDLSGAGYGTDQICVFCHTPHNAKTPQLAPLWNHVSSTASYTLYSSPSLTAVPTQPADNSKACLSCHDGTVAVDAYGTRTTGTSITGTALLGTNLSDDHPISFTYDSALATADGGLVTPASPGSVVAGIPLYGGTLQCASCHNVHENTAPAQPFLRFGNAASALCLKCHLK